VSKQITIKSQVYHNFIHSLSSEATKEDYSKSIRYLMEYLHVTDYEELITKDVKVIQKNIIDFLIYCKEIRKVSPATIHSYLYAIKRFYDMNDIVPNWKKIKVVIILCLW
jgi:site-specific recombinase XerD